MIAASTNDIEFRAVTKRFGDVTAVSEIDLALPKGAFVALLGPSGCGKTTCLRMIGGFEQPSEGTVIIEHRPMNGVPPYQRPVNMVFQHYALFPHLDVEANVSYGLRQMRPRMDRAPKFRAGRQKRWSWCGLAASANGASTKCPAASSSASRSARAIVNRPAVLLLDEPLAALDRKLRTAMQIELQTLQRELGITFLLVTHDQEEALSMSDIVCVMNAGKVVQTGSPQDIYDQPGIAVRRGFRRQDQPPVRKRREPGGSLRLADGTALPMTGSDRRHSGCRLAAGGNPPAPRGRRLWTGGHSYAPHLPRLTVSNIGRHRRAWRFSGHRRPRRRERTCGAGRTRHALLRSGTRFTSSQPESTGLMQSTRTREHEMTTHRTTPITAAELTAEFMRLKRGSVTRRHFLGVTGLGLATAVLGGAHRRLRARRPRPGSRHADVACDLAELSRSRHRSKRSPPRPALPSRSTFSAPTRKCWPSCRPAAPAGTFSFQRTTRSPPTPSWA